MDHSQIKGRFHIYTGYREGGKILNELQAGEGYAVDGSARSYYIVKMWAFPKEVFFLCPNKDNDGNFTLFAKRTGGENDPSFRRPVGFGFVSRELKQHLEIQFTFPRQRVFMSLFPDKVTFDSLFGADGGVA